SEASPDPAPCSPPATPEAGRGRTVLHAPDSPTRPTSAGKGPITALAWKHFSRYALPPPSARFPVAHCQDTSVPTRYDCRGFNQGWRHVMLTWTNGCRLLLALAMMVSGAACAKKKPPAPVIDFSRSLPPGQVALRKITPDQYPDFSPAFSNANLVAVDASIGHSLDYLSRASSRGYFPYLDIDHPRAVATLVKLREMVKRELSGARTSPSALNAEIAANFEVYKSVGAPDPAGGYTERVLFTGYYTPILEASLTREGPYQYPLYKRPDDLASDPIT